MLSDVSIVMTSSILHFHLFASLLLLVGADESSRREDKRDSYEE